MKPTYILTLLLCLTYQLAFAQCFPDRHNTNAYDGWISCETSPHPVEGLDDGHWLMYDFGKVQDMYTSKIWNLNNPDHLDWNMKEAEIHYSRNGTKWDSLGMVTFSQASGIPIYEGVEGPDFGGIKARYVIITPISNYGGSCVGFSEIRIYTTPNN